MNAEINLCRVKISHFYIETGHGLDQGEASGEGSGKEGSDPVCLYNSDILDFCINFFLNIELLFLFVTEFSVPPSLCYP